MFQNGTGQAGPSPARAAERRETVRHAHVEPIHLTTQWGTLVASLMDLSTTGAQVRVANGLVPLDGDEVMLRLVDGHHLSGSIVWSARDALGISFEQALPRLDDLLWLEQRGPDWFHASVRSRITKRPRTMVWTGRPFTLRPCQGEIFERDCILASSMVHSRVRSTSARSASAPGWIAPFRG